MSKISLSITKELLASLDSYCEQFKYERSEAIRQSIRNTIYPKDIPLPPLEGIEVPKTKEVSTVPVREVQDEGIPKEISGWCQVHFEKGVNYVIKLITWEDENANPIIDKKWACPKCIEKYENIGRGRVFFL